MSAAARGGLTDREGRNDSFKSMSGRLEGAERIEGGEAITSRT